MIEIIAIHPFRRELKKLAKKYRSIAKDYEQLLNQLEANPYSGIDLGRGVRKVRMTITAKGKGKSHGARVITYTDAIFSIDNGVLYLITIYDKADRANITDKEIEALLQQLDDITLPHDL